VKKQQRTQHTQNCRNEQDQLEVNNFFNNNFNYTDHAKHMTVTGFPSDSETGT
jgi:hypothetical protein